MKVFGVGFNKTGTTTLHMCCQQFGFRHRTWSPTMINHYVKKNYDEIYQFSDKYDSFEDWPWNLLYQEFDQRYPDAKFILTIRKDSEVWYHSLVNHIKRYHGG